jgi:hypothetical protein
MKNACLTPKSCRAAHHVWTTLLCATVGVVACRRAPEPHLVGPFPRCYRLAVGPWKIPQDAKYPEQRSIPPTPQLLLLDAARTEGLLGIPPKDSPWRLLRGESADSAWTAFERAQPLRGWRVEGDSLFTAFTTPFGGLGMDFRIVGDSLLGQVDIISDMGGVEYPTAPAKAVRVSCPSS